MIVSVNGTEYPIESASGEKSLAMWLREDLMLTGTKIGCDIGVCGSCTVLLDNKAVRSCKIKLKDAVGKNVVTIEGMVNKDGKLHPIQQAFVDCGAIQCGFCTPGFVMAAKAFLDRNPNPAMEQVETGLGGNLCRCGTYVGIRKAVLEAAKQMTGGRNA